MLANYYNAMVVVSDEEIQARLGAKLATLPGLHLTTMTGAVVDKKPALFLGVSGAAATAILIANDLLGGQLYWITPSTHEVYRHADLVYMGKLFPLVPKDYNLFYSAVGEYTIRQEEKI